MHDLKERLRVLDMASPPDVWQEAIGRRGQELLPPPALTGVGSGSRRLAMLALAAALVVLIGLGLSAGSSEKSYSMLVPTSAMEPTLRQGQCATVDTDAYAAGRPLRGDVIAFRDPVYPALVMIKRIIGLPGERIEQIHGVVFVDGDRLDEPYALLDRPGSMDGAWIVEDDHFFVMGDNRPISNDSRSTLGQVPFDAVEGRVLVEKDSSECDVSAPPAPVAER
jgi:signal peptidase I